jgi:DNA (cytosine-5)-methyltransferase 1
MMKHNNDNNEPLRFLSVCSGIEAASVAWGPLGWKAVAFSEIEKFPSAVLAHHYPDVPNLGDFTQIDTTTLGHVDILCGGTPCQAFSVAGLRNSLADARGNLTLSFVRLAHELAGIAEIGPEADGLVRSSERQHSTGNGLRNVVWENVPGVLNTKDNAFGCFLGALVGASDPLPAPRGTKWSDAGMVSGPKGRAAWRVLDAQYFGLAQRRRRVIVVADFGNGADPAAVLFELEGVLGNPAPSREARQSPTHDVAPSLVSSGRGVSRTGDTRGQDPVVAWSIMPQNSGKDYKARQVDVAQPLMAGGPVGGNQGGDYIQQPVAYDIHGTPASNIATATDIHTPLRARTPGQFENSTVTVAVSPVAYAPEIARCVATREGSSQDYESTTMVAVGGPVGGNQGGDYIQQPVAFGGNRTSGPLDVATAVNAHGGPHGRLDFESETFVAQPIAATLDASFGRLQGASGQDANHGHSHLVVKTVAIRGRDGGATAELGGEVATALRASQGGGDKPHVLAPAKLRVPSLAITASNWTIATPRLALMSPSITPPSDA